MKAVTWHGQRDVRVEEVPDPFVQEPTDAVIRVTTIEHLRLGPAPLRAAGAVHGRRATSSATRTWARSWRSGSAVGDLKVGDRVSIPFQISCGHCWMCQQQLYTQCETTQVREHGTGAALFGFSKLYGEVAGGQAEYLRVPQAQFTHITLPEGPPDDRFAYLSDILPTAWQGVEYAAVPEGGTLVVLGLGPIGDFACRIAQHKGYRVIGVDLVPERLERVRARGIEVVDLERARGGPRRRHPRPDRRPRAGLGAGRRRHGGARVAGHELRPEGGRRCCPRRDRPRRSWSTPGVDRLNALYSAIDIVRRGGTISLSGVYGGAADPMPMMTMFDKQIQLRMGQCNIKRWIPEIMPLLTDADPLGVDTFATHRVPLSEAPEMYRKFQKKEDGVVKVQLKPEL